MKIEEALPYLIADKKIHCVVYHADGNHLVRGFYVETSSDGKFMLFDKKTHKRLDDSSSDSYNYKYAIGIAFIQANWEIYEGEDNWNLADNYYYISGGEKSYQEKYIKTFIQKVKEDIKNGWTKPKNLDDYYKIIDLRTGKL